MARADLSTASVDLADVQGLLHSGYGDLGEACFLLFRVADPRAARRWLRAAPVTPASERRADTVLQVAFTAAGLHALGLDPSVLAGFSAEFLAGMASDPARSRRLGDIGRNAPAAWRWGVEPEPHMLLALYARTELAAWRARVTEGMAEGFALLQELATSDMGGHEPFGFVDGVSQPAIDWSGRRVPGTAADLEYGNLLAAGEFILGYPNEYGEHTDLALIANGNGFGRNGSYLVFRELRQDVRAFWRALAERAGAEGPVALAEALVGRRLSGEPLLPSGRSLPGLRPGQDIRDNGFDYDGDPIGVACPLGAHVRRANPRSADMPGGRQSALARLARTLGVYGVDLRQDLIAATRFHRLLRRGREFGARLTPEAALLPDGADPQAGLMFITLGANIARQFEFVQSAWIMNGKFAGLDDEPDPLLGQRERGGGFTLARANGVGCRLQQLRSFVTVAGGAYFFLPGLRAIQALAEPNA